MDVSITALLYPIVRLPLLQVGVGPPYSASVTIVSGTIVSSGEYRRSRDP
jgi:hypothetical protein